MINMELWMIFVGILSAFAEFPQAIRILKRKSSGDISLTTWVIIYFAQVSWLRYGYDIESICIMVTNSINLIFTVVIMVLCMKYRNGRDKKCGK